ncbi:FAD-binding oxidoreductase [Kitasatospora sp. NPDC056138]|uniref:FAD-binding oxidoreductase n=1 Tax=Kitasatospora sp. NPDC056138 TaxID=3345724 RepID=UPI0035DC3970
MLAGTSAVLGAAAAASVGAAGPAPAAPGPAAPAAPGGTPFGPVTVAPGDARYPDLVSGMNQRWSARPEAVQLVDSTERVVAVVQQAVRAGKRVSIRSGGHCYEDFAYNAEVQVVIDMSEMTAVYYDEQRAAFAVEAGATNLHVYERLYKAYGVVLPAGVCYSVGAGGHVSGGGWGLLARKYGLAADHLHAVEVVVVDRDGTARAVVATREAGDPNRELWWAHTGAGGGSFGVITRYWFRTPGATGAPGDLLPKPPAEVYLSAVSWPWEQLTESSFTTLVRNYAAWHAAHATAGTPYDGLFANFNLNHRSNGEISLLTQMDATRPDSRQLLNVFLADITEGVDVPHGAATAPMGEHGPMPEYATPQRLPWLQATRYLGTTNHILVDPTLRGDQKSAYMRKGFPDGQLRKIYRHLTRTDFTNPGAMLLLSAYGGRVNSLAPGDTASVHRDSIFKLLYQTYWSAPEDDARNIGWLREFYEDVYAETGGVPVPNDTTDGCYVNYPDIDLSDPGRNTSQVPWSTLYWGSNYPRLQQVKAVWDPRDFFRHGQSVRLPGK